MLGDGFVYFAAPDICWTTAFEKSNPDRAAQIYANNASRVTAVRPGAKGEANQTHIAWSETKGVPGVPSPLYYEGRLYTFLNGGIVFHRLAKTGALLYSGRLGALGYYYASPVAADQKVFIASEEGVVVVLAAGDQLNVLARNKLDGAILATPAIVDGKIYVRTESSVAHRGATSTTLPRLMTNAILDVFRMSRVGSARRTTRSACLPTEIVPTLSCSRMTRDATLVAAAIACDGVNPASSTSSWSSR